MVDRLKKTERLIKIWVILHNNPQGYTVQEMAERFDVDIRTIYSDLKALDSELGIPVFDDDDKRWKLNYEKMLPPLRFTIPEALNIFLAVRLMVGYSKRYDPNMDATFSKLGSILPKPLGEQVQKTVDWMHGFRTDEKYLRTLSELARVWVEQKRVTISYRSFEAHQASERTIEPYFIQPAAAGHSSYVVALCRKVNEIRNFKVERIESIQIMQDKYTIPEDFDANKYFDSSWGIIVEGEAKTIRLKFDAGIARIFEETIWHPSQMLKRQKDGSLLMTLQVMDTVELYSWILSWGERVEVLEPKELREDIINTAEAMSKVYKKK
ncbi:MAG: YafY family transcriptional regulator [Dehalococcoidales bacterium]|nr:YafY family transcriptional regulator [Dehalococcoidales bacterium]